MTPAQKVAAWPDAAEWTDLFVERSGIFMDNGDPVRLADQRAFLEVSRLRRERGEK